MSRRTSLIGLVLSVLALVVTLVVATGIGPSVPGPPVRSWLGIGDPPLPDLCAADPKQVLDPGGEPGPGAWRPERPSPTPSPEPGAVAIGRYVYLVGGQLREGTEPTVLRYDTKTGEYRREPDAPVAIDHPVVVAHAGEVILAGGYVDGAVSTAQMWAYSPRSRRWRELPAMATARAAAAGATIGDELYLVGGLREFGNQYQPYGFLEIYDYETQRWRAGPDMPTARHHVGAAVVDGKLFVAGGRQPSDESLNSFEEFDPATNRWRRLPPVPVGTGSPGVTAIDGKVVVTGGGDDQIEDDETGFVLKATFAYDPESERWSRLPDMGKARHGHVAAAAAGRVYVFRGIPCPGYGELSSVESLPAADVR